jgi:hypothetical protein
VHSPSTEWTGAYAIDIAALALRGSLLPLSAVFSVSLEKSPDQLGCCGNTDPLAIVTAAPEAQNTNLERFHFSFEGLVLSLHSSCRFHQLFLLPSLFASAFLRCLAIPLKVGSTRSGWFSRSQTALSSHLRLRRCWWKCDATRFEAVAVTFWRSRRGIAVVRCKA